MSLEYKVFIRSLVFVAIVCFASLIWSQESQPLIYPKLLKPGDTIMFVAPAGELDRERMTLAKKRLEERGYLVKMREDLFAKDGYLAGSDERRAEELMQAFRDPEVDAIFPGTGGYGVMRILAQLDYDVIRQNPKLLIGFSDITGLHAALNRQSGLVTYHSPNPMWGLGSQDNLQPFSSKYFFRAVEEGPESQQDYTIEIPADVPQPISLGTGTARGRLTGGNLSLIAALEGTPYAVDTQDAILLIEDVSEAPYRIDRMLRQLQLAGKLQPLRGAILGQFTKTEEREKNEVKNPRYSAEGVLRQYFEPLGIPVLMNFPIGHHEMNCTLPLGGEVEINADKGTLRVIGSNQHLETPNG
ncbi:S66 peptidase family protein [Bythopirellula polymerisocia]|uniref:Putative murein peptide carboxypeptidase n=1 Tax=Bythopirellula polymerisocia TaxID=2528003 RepID=A0A5C6CYE9_9BACT|nr:LD-carboxypeptidase [Bythopirellula polymerisocia]TWU29963.1 putative murein peptide carboxypeptidase [Bythopirellula polymerisocia]